MNNEAKQFVHYVKDLANKYEVSLLFPQTSTVKYSAIQRSSGYFMEESNRIVKATLACAMGNPHWLEILVHESCHMQQWIAKSKLWTKCTFKGEDVNDVIEDWVERKVELTEAQLEYCIRKVQHVELDCEQRSVEKIKEFNLPIDINKYIKQANAYIYSYAAIKKYRNLSNRFSYDSPALIGKMSKKFHSDVKMYQFIPRYAIKHYESIYKDERNEK